MLNKLLGFFLFFLILSCFSGIAQIRPNDEGGINTGNDFNSDVNNPFANDTTKVKRGGSRILDDSTKMVYGPTTATYIYQNDWYYITGQNNIIDTGIVNIHRYNYVAQRKFEYQDLANLGTAIKPIYYTLPNNVGQRAGLNAITPYILDDHNLKYYNTKSPFTSWNYVQGAQGRSIIDVSMAQNINPNLDVAFYYRGINSSVLVGTEQQNQEDKHTHHQTFLFNTRYESKNKRYKLMAHASTYRHLLNETGGVNTEDSVEIVNDQNETVTQLRPISEYFELERSQLTNRLINVDGYSRREKIHIYHQYGFFGDSASYNSLQLFHELNNSKSKYEYEDDDLQTNIDFYEDIFTDASSDIIRHHINYKTVEHKVGLKGKLGNIFYSGFFRYNNIEFKNLYKRVDIDVSSTTVSLNTSQNNPQLSFGFDVNYNLNDKFIIGGKGEYIDSDIFRIEGNVKSKYLDASFKTYKFEPSFIQNDVYSFSNQLSKNYKSTETNQLKIALKKDMNNLKLKPFFEFSTIKNHIYFDSTLTANQESSTLKILKAGLDIELKTGSFYQKIHGVYAQNDELNLIRMPELFINYQIYFENEVFKKALFFQLGLDIHWQKAYFADAYMPLNQQFYLQNRYCTGDYLNVDLFMNYRIKRVTMFAKITNIAQLPETGYYVTPDYMGQPRSFEFGLTWLLFD